MRRTAVVLTAVLVLAGCGASGHSSPPPHPAALSGTVVLVGGTGQHAVVGLTHDNRCYGVGPNRAFAIDAPLQVQVGDHVVTTTLGPGDIITPGNEQTVTGCRFPFTVTDLATTASSYTVTVAGVHQTVSRPDLSVPLTVQVTGTPSD